MLLLYKFFRMVFIVQVKLMPNRNRFPRHISRAGGHRKSHVISLGVKSDRYMGRTNAESYRLENYRLVSESLFEAGVDHIDVPINSVSEYRSRVAVEYKYLECVAAMVFSGSKKTRVEMCFFKIQLRARLLFCYFFQRALVMSVYVKYECKARSDISCVCASEIEFYSDSNEYFISLGFHNDFGCHIPKTEIVKGDMRSSIGAVSPGNRYVWKKQLESEAGTARNFPIDVVYTWVDGSDAEWLRQKNCMMGITGPGLGTEDARYRNRDELKYSLRSLAFSTNFVRKVFVVTNGQVPEWLNLGNERIELVRHSEIFRDVNQSLPTFNSHAIETNIHRIKGLSERYIYLNDDFLFLGRNSSSNYFTFTGKPRVFLNEWDSLWPPYLDNPYFSAANSTAELIEREFGRVVSRVPRHGPYAQLKSVVDRIESKCEVMLMDTERARFRRTEDISLPASLSLIWLLMSGEGEVGVDVTASTVSLTGKLKMVIALAARSVFRDRMHICVNDTESGMNRRRQAGITQVLNAFFNDVYPLKSEFER